MHVVVTGAGGFSGSNLVPALLGRGHRVTAVVGRTAGRLSADVRTPALEVISGNLSAAVTLFKRPDVIVHAAARSPAPGVTSADMASDNTLATLRLIECAQDEGASTFVYFSSLSIYGTIAALEVSENTPIVSPDVYGITKYAGEVALRDAAMRSLSIRLPGVLGRNSVRNWLTGVLAAARSGRDITYYNPDAPFNNAIHIADLCDFVGNLIEGGGWTGHSAVTVGAGGMTTVRRAVEIVAGRLGSASKLIALAEPRPHFTISSDAARRLGYRPMEIEALLARFADENRD